MFRLLSLATFRCINTSCSCARHEGIGGSGTASQILHGGRVASRALYGRLREKNLSGIEPLIYRPQLTVTAVGIPFQTTATYKNCVQRSRSARQSVICYLHAVYVGEIDPHTLVLSRHFTWFQLEGHAAQKYRTATCIDARWYYMIYGWCMVCCECNFGLLGPFHYRDHKSTPMYYTHFLFPYDL